MTAQHGSITDVYVNGFDLTAYLRSIELPASCDISEKSTFGSAWKAYLAGLVDASVSGSGVFEAGAGTVHAIMTAAFAASEDAVWTVMLQGDGALGNIGYGLGTVQTAYGVESPIGDIVSCSAEGQGNPDRDRVVCLHPLGAETSDGEETTVDNGAATSDGGVAYIHCTAFGGTNITVIIQESSDNFVADTSTLCSFTQITAANAHQRLEIASGTAVKRYVRASWTGTFTSATFHVSLCRK